MAKLSVMRGIFYSRVFSIACVQTGTRLVSIVWSRGVRYSGVANVLKYMEKHSGHLKVSVTIVGVRS